MKYRIKRIKVKHHIICGCDPENSTHYHFAGLAPWKNNRLGLHLQGQHRYGHQFKFKTFQLPANVPDKAQEMSQILGPCTHMGMLDQIQASSFRGQALSIAAIWEEINRMKIFSPNPLLSL